MKINVVAKFNTPRNANGFINRAFETTGKSLRIFMGDDETFWIVTMADGERLLAAGYEEMPA